MLSIFGCCCCCVACETQFLTAHTARTHHGIDNQNINYTLKCFVLTSKLKKTTRLEHKKKKKTRK